MSVMEVEQSVVEQVVGGEPMGLDALDEQLLDQFVGARRRSAGSSSPARAGCWRR